MREGKLDPKSWLHLAQTLDVGESKRFDHDCGDGSTLKCDHKAHGWGAWCWRCNADGWVPHPEESFAQRMARLTAAKAVEQEVARSVVLPTPMEYNASLWPAEARLWLYRIGMSNDDIRRAGFYWNSRIERVVLPVTSDKGVVYWQGRNVSKGDGRPKYLNPVVDKSGTFAKFEQEPGSGIVLTEDILSAWKVGRVTTAWSLLGTALSELQCLALLRDGRPVYVWLDPDGPGQKAASKIYRKLRAYGVNARIIRSDTDPKLMTREQIMDKIKEARKNE